MRVSHEFRQVARNSIRYIERSKKNPNRYISASALLQFKHLEVIDQFIYVKSLTYFYHIKRSRLYRYHLKRVMLILSKVVKEIDEEDGYLNEEILSFLRMKQVWDKEESQIALIFNTWSIDFDRIVYTPGSITYRGRCPDFPNFLSDVNEHVHPVKRLILLFSIDLPPDLPHLREVVVDGCYVRDDEIRDLLNTMRQIDTFAI